MSKWNELYLQVKLKYLFRHCLPPGYIFKKKGEAKLDEEEQETLEQKIDERIAKLGVKGTPVTLERHIFIYNTVKNLKFLHFRPLQCEITYFEINLSKIEILD